LDKHNQTLDRLAKLAFGPSADIDGDFGGQLRIVVSGRVIGTGWTFQEALASAQRAMGWPWLVE